LLNKRDVSSNRKRNICIVRVDTMDGGSRYGGEKFVVLTMEDEKIHLEKRGGTV